MTGDAPQPGETPHTEGIPWSFDPDAAWWRGDGDRDEAEALAEAAAQPPQARRGSAVPTLPPPAPGGTDVTALGETLDAHAAGVQDAAEALTDTQAAGVQDAAAALMPEPAPAAATEPDVMVMPEPDPNRTRPTVSLEHAADRQVPGQSGATRPASAGRAAQRIRMENSTFWLTDEERAAVAADPALALPGTVPTGPGPADGRRGQPPEVRQRAPRRGAPGMFALMALALIAAFFSWVTAEPFWLAVGHGQHGVATVSRCTGSGVTQRCAGSFLAAGGAYRAQPVMLLGVDPASRNPGATAPARMVNSGSKQAYVGATGLLVHLRWVLGLVMVLLCGVGIAGLTGTRRLETQRARRAALVISVAGPVVLLAGFLVAAY